MDFNGGILYPVCERFAGLPPYVVLEYGGVGAVGVLFDGCEKFLQGFSDSLGP
jgi:hypothetical protein